MAKAVFCIAKSEEQATSIVNQLKEAGFSNNDVSVLLPDRAGSRDFAHEHHTKAPEGAATGAIAGGVMAGVLGWLVGIGSLAIPGVGPLIAAGPILAALSGAAAGGAVGGLAGAPGRTRDSRIRSQAVRRQGQKRQHPDFGSHRRQQGTLHGKEIFDAPMPTTSHTAARLASDHR